MNFEKIEKMPAQPANAKIEYIKKLMDSRELLEDALEKTRKLKKEPGSVDPIEAREAKEKYENSASELRDMRKLFSAEENVELNRLDDMRLIDLDEILKSEMAIEMGK